MRATRVITAIISTVLAATLAALAGCATTTPFPTTPTLPTVQAVQLGQPFQPIPGVTVTVSARAGDVPVIVLGVPPEKYPTTPGVIVTVTYRNDTDKVLAGQGTLAVQITDADGNAGASVALAGGKQLGPVQPGHTGTLITSAALAHPDQPITVTVHDPTFDQGRTLGGPGTTTVVGIPTAK